MIDEMIKGNPCPYTPQNKKEVSYCKKLFKEDFMININDDIHSILAKIKAFSPMPGATLILENKSKVKILDAEIKNDLLIPLIVKPEGKSQMSYHDYCLGHPEGLPILGKRK